MTTRLSRVLLLLVWPATVGLAPSECPPLETAHQRFLAGSFALERTFLFRVNGALKRREVANLTYADGALEIEVLEEETPSKGLVIDGEGDPVVDLVFSCSRLDALGEGRFALTSEDGTETATFVLDAERQALRPVGWRFGTTERFLFKKFEIEGRADYDDFEWGDAARP